MDEDQIKKALDDKFESVEEEVTDIKDKVANTDEKLTSVETEIAKTNDTLKVIGEDIEELKSRGEDKILTFGDEAEKFFKDNLNEIKTIKESGAGIIEFTPKAVTNASGSNVGTPTNVGYSKPDVLIEQYASIYGLFTVTNTNKASFPYTELVPSGDADVVAEGGLKPEVGFTWVTRWSAPTKIAAHEILSDEVIDDVPQLRSLAEEVLLRKHNIKKIKNSIDYVIANSGAFVAGGLATLIDSPKFMDVINSVAVSIYMAKNYADDISVLPNAALVNPIDFYVNFVTAKDSNGNYMYPTATFYNFVKVGGLIIAPSDIVATGKVLVADMKAANLVNYKPYYIKIGWINDQLIHNMFTMVGESRYHLFIKEQHKKRFVYDDYTTIETAIEKP